MVVDMSEMDWQHITATTSLESLVLRECHLGPFADVSVLTALTSMALQYCDAADFDL